jgi:hypothetical protein
MKKNTVLGCLILFALSFFNVTFAQSITSNSQRTPNGKIRCLTNEYEQYLKVSNPSRQNASNFEAWIAPKIAEMKANKSADATTLITIPVVVHVIHNGDAIGANENISDAQILSQITVLNQDFRKLVGTPGYNTNAVGADLQIEFCLAQRKPDGTATTGIDRVQKTAANYATMANTESMKSSTIWDPTQYFNIWSVFFTNNTSAEMYGTLGYAQFPQIPAAGTTGFTIGGTSAAAGYFEQNATTANTDGLVIDYRAFGTSDIVSSLSANAPYDKGRTASHEIGHCFGLVHIWGDSNCGTDYCTDTPTAHTSNFGCPTVTNCISTGNEMVQNYMDYTDDTCMNIFTLNQKDRITQVMNFCPRRVSLKTSLACSPPLSKDEMEYFNAIKIVPNPVREVLNINIGQLDLPDSMTIYNDLGQTILSKKVSTINDMSVNTESYSVGNYIVILTKNSSSRAYHFIKQ